MKKRWREERRGQGVNEEKHLVGYTSALLLKSVFMYDHGGKDGGRLFIGNFRLAFVEGAMSCIKLYHILLQCGSNRTCISSINQL